MRHLCSHCKGALSKQSRGQSSIYWGVSIFFCGRPAFLGIDNITLPPIIKRKKGDLADLFVYKFHSQGQLYLLGYTLDDVVQLVYLEAIGPHENCYCDLKR